MSSSRQSGRSRRRETEPHMRPYDSPEPSTRTTRSRARASSGDAPMPPPRPTSRTTLFTAVIEEPSRSTMETTPAARLSSAFRPVPSTPNTPRNRPLVRLSLTPHAKGGLFKRKVERLADMSNECFDEIIAAGTSAGGGSGDSSRQAERNWDALYANAHALLLHEDSGPFTPAQEIIEDLSPAFRSNINEDELAEALTRFTLATFVWVVFRPDDAGKLWKGKGKEKAGPDNNPRTLVRHRNNVLYLAWQQFWDMLPTDALGNETALEAWMGLATIIHATYDCHTVDPFTPPSGNLPSPPDFGSMFGIVDLQGAAKARWTQLINERQKDLEEHNGDKAPFIAYPEFRREMLRFVQKYIYPEVQLQEGGELGAFVPPLDPGPSSPKESSDDSSDGESEADAPRQGQTSTGRETPPRHESPDLGDMTQEFDMEMFATIVAEMEEEGEGSWKDAGRVEDVEGEEQNDDFLGFPTETQLDPQRVNNDVDDDVLGGSLFPSETLLDPSRQHDSESQEYETLGRDLLPSGSQLNPAAKRGDQPEIRISEPMEEDWEQGDDELGDMLPSESQFAPRDSYDDDEDEFADMPPSDSQLAPREDYGDEGEYNDDGVVDMPPSESQFALDNGDEVADDDEDSVQLPPSDSQFAPDEEDDNEDEDELSEDNQYPHDINALPSESQFAPPDDEYEKADDEGEDEPPDNNAYPLETNTLPSESQFAPTGEEEVEDYYDNNNDSNNDIDDNHDNHDSNDGADELDPTPAGELLFAPSNRDEADELDVTPAVEPLFVPSYQDDEENALPPPNPSYDDRESDKDDDEYFDEVYVEEEERYSFYSDEQESVDRTGPEYHGLKLIIPVKIERTPSAPRSVEASEVGDDEDVPAEAHLPTPSTERHLPRPSEDGDDALPTETQVAPGHLGEPGQQSRQVTPDADEGVLPAQPDLNPVYVTDADLQPDADLLPDTDQPADDSLPSVPSGDQINTHVPAKQAVVNQPVSQPDPPDAVVNPAAEAPEPGPLTPPRPTTESQANGTASRPARSSDAASSPTAPQPTANGIATPAPPANQTAYFIQSRRRTLEGTQFASASPEPEDPDDEALTPLPPRIKKIRGPEASPEPEPVRKPRTSQLRQREESPNVLVPYPSAPPVPEEEEQEEPLLEVNHAGQDDEAVLNEVNNRVNREVRPEPRPDRQQARSQRRQSLEQQLDDIRDVFTVQQPGHAARGIPGARGSRAVRRDGPDLYMVDEDGRPLVEDPEMIIPAGYVKPKSVLFGRADSSNYQYARKTRPEKWKWSPVDTVFLYREIQKVPMSQPNPCAVIEYLHGEFGTLDKRFMFQCAQKLKDKMRTTVETRANNGLPVAGRARQFLPPRYRERQAYDRERQEAQEDEEEERAAELATQRQEEVDEARWREEEEDDEERRREEEEEEDEERRRRAQERKRNVLERERKKREARRQADLDAGRQAELEAKQKALRDWSESFFPETDEDQSESESEDDVPLAASQRKGKDTAPGRSSQQGYNAAMHAADLDFRDTGMAQDDDFPPPFPINHPPSSLRSERRAEVSREDPPPRPRDRVMVEIPLPPRHDEEDKENRPVKRPRNDSGSEYEGADSDSDADADDQAGNTPDPSTELRSTRAQSAASAPRKTRATTAQRAIQEDNEIESAPENEPEPEPPRKRNKRAPVQLDDDSPPAKRTRNAARRSEVETRANRAEGRSTGRKAKAGPSTRKSARTTRAEPIFKRASASNPAPGFYPDDYDDYDEFRGRRGRKAQGSGPPSPVDPAPGFYPEDYDYMYDDSDVEDPDHADERMDEDGEGGEEESDGEEEALFTHGPESDSEAEDEDEINIEIKQEVLSAPEDEDDREDEAEREDEDGDEGGEPHIQTLPDSQFVRREMIRRRVLGGS